MSLTALSGAAIFDGETLHHNKVLLLEHGMVTDLSDVVPDGADHVALPGGILAPGFVDLQVNGGDGLMLNDAPSVATIRRMAEANARVGTTALLPTLITDRPETTRATVEAAIAACGEGVPGLLGLHLEGPHLSVARKGAHDPALIRAMEPDDMALYLDAAARLPVLKLTVAPETVTPDQISELVAAGVLVSLGHTDATADTCLAAAHAGARCVTHLFNAMRQLGNREPGVVGAALDSGDLSAGLIADGIHVHPISLRAAIAAKRGPGQLFLVTDAMAPIGTEQTEFNLGGRRILRRDGRLTLADGTLAGADLDFPRAVEVMVKEVGVTPEQALAMATSIPANLIGADVGHLRPGAVADMVHLDDGYRLTRVWRSGAPLP